VFTDQLKVMREEGECDQRVTPKDRSRDNEPRSESNQWSRTAFFCIFTRVNLLHARTI